MLSVKIIQESQNFQLPSKWQAVSQKEERVVDQNGNAVGSGYTGQRYKVLSDAKLADSIHKKRRAKALVAIIFTLGLIYCCPKNREKIKALLNQREKLFITPEASLARAEPIAQEIIQEEEVPQEVPLPKEVTYEEAEVALGRGVNVSEELKERLRTLMPDIIRGYENDALEVISRAMYITFTMKDAPDLVFTTRMEFNKGNELEEDFKNVVLGKQVVMQHRLDLVQIPDTALIKIPTEKGEFVLMVERRMPYDGPYKVNCEEQKDVYYTSQHHLKPIVEQLCKFVYEARIGHVDHRFYPLSKLEREVFVMNLKKYGGKSPEKSFEVGRKLIAMMPNEELIDTVIEEGKKLAPELDFGADKEAQLRNIEDYYEYKAFLSRKKLLGDEKIVIHNFNTLKLDLEKEWEYFDWKNEYSSGSTKWIVRRIVDQINYWIKFNTNSTVRPNSHVKNKRCVTLLIDSPEHHRPFSRQGEFLFDWETAMMPILEALRLDDYIFSYKKLSDTECEIRC